MDARKNMCYYAKYDINGEVIKEPQLINIEDLQINDKIETVISDKVMQDLLNKENIEAICYTDINEDLGKYLGILTNKALLLGKEFHWATVKPLYLQKPSITMPKKQMI